MIAKTDDILTDYDAYQFSIRHLKNQNKRSITSNGSCMYRYTGQDKGIIEEYVQKVQLCCAVGCLITDYAYNEQIEDVNVDNEQVVSALETSHPSWKMDDSSIVLLKILQSIHDSGEPEYWGPFFDLMEKSIFQSDNEKVSNDEFENLASLTRNYLDNEFHPHADIIRIGRNIIDVIETYILNLR